MYVCNDLLNQERLTDLLTAHTQNFIFSISSSLSLSFSQHLLFTVLRMTTLGMKWGWGLLHRIASCSYWLGRSDGWSWLLNYTERIRVVRAISPFSYCVGASPLHPCWTFKIPSAIWLCVIVANIQAGRPETFFNSRPRRIIVFPTVGSEPHLRFN